MGGLPDILESSWQAKVLPDRSKRWRDVCVGFTTTIKRVVGIQFLDREHFADGEMCSHSAHRYHASFVSRRIHPVALFNHTSYILNHDVREKNFNNNHFGLALVICAVSIPKTLTMMAKESSFAMLLPRRTISLRPFVTLALMALFFLVPTVAAFGPPTTPSFRASCRLTTSSRLSALPSVDVDILRALSDQASSGGAAAPKAVETVAGIGVLTVGALGAAVAFAVIILGTIAVTATNFANTLGEKFIEGFREKHPERFEELKQLAETEFKADLVEVIGEIEEDDEFLFSGKEKNVIIMRTIMREEEEISRGILKKFFSETYGEKDDESAAFFADQLIKIRRIADEKE